MAPQAEMIAGSSPATVPEAIVVTNSSTSTMVPDSIGSTDSPDTNPSFLTVPREIRNKILSHLFLEPKAPDFVAKSPTTTYKNFFAISEVNKQLNAEAKEELVKSRNLVIFTTNGGPCLNKDLAEHDIPIISTQAARKASKLSVMRLHVRFPGHQPLRLAPNRVTSTAIMLASDLPKLSRFLRYCSLQLSHSADPDGPPEFDLELVFPRMSMAISFSPTLHLSAPKQRALLGLLSRANCVGKIAISGTSDDTVSVVLPGHSEHFEAGPEVTDLTKREKFMFDGFKAARKQDGLDYISISDWLQALGIKAWKAGNLELAYVRYADAARFASVAFTVNQSVTALYQNIAIKLRGRYLKAEISQVWALTEMGKWLDASVIAERNLAELDPSLMQTKKQKDAVTLLEALLDKCTRHINANPDLRKQRDEWEHQCPCCGRSEEGSHESSLEASFAAFTSMAKGVQFLYD